MKKTIATVTIHNTSHKIFRAGKPKREGGEGVQWSCSCQAYTSKKWNGVSRPCFAMLSLWHRVLKNSAIKYTVFGRKVMKVAA